jgi:hypothetical protein
MFIASVLAGRSALAERFRASRARWLSISWTAIIAIVALGALLRAHHAVGPSPAAAQPAAAADAEESHG